MHDWVMCYDIEDTSARRRACRLLRRYSNGYQDSGFEITSPHKPEQLTTALANHIGDDDHLLISRRDQKTPDWQLGRTNSLPTSNLLIWT